MLWFITYEFLNSLKSSDDFAQYFRWIPFLLQTNTKTMIKWAFRIFWIYRVSFHCMSRNTRMNYTYKYFTYTYKLLSWWPGPTKFWKSQVNFRGSLEISQFSIIIYPTNRSRLALSILWCISRTTKNIVQMTNLNRYRICSSQNVIISLILLKKKIFFKFKLLQKWFKGIIAR